MSLASLTYLKPLVARVLRDYNTIWSVQGFGMMRTYFGPPDNPKEFRLNLWDSRLAVPGVSTIHDHPWDFESIIVSGAFINQRFHFETDYDRATHVYTTIKTGEGGGMEKSPTKTCILEPSRPELYQPGDIYRQKANEIHETIYVDGCITLNQRVGDTQHARVFWPTGTQWVDAEPRAATPVERAAAIAQALERF